MKSYPSIPVWKNDFWKFPVYLFEKLDGSLIRAEWSKKQGFYKFGSRNELIDEKHPFLAESIDLIQKDHADLISKSFLSRKIERAICFFEFLGPSSFAGWHEINEKHEVVLFDISVYKKGFFSPKNFLELTHDFCDAVRLPKWIKLELTPETVDLIRAGKLTESSFEGVIVKFENKRKESESYKIKTHAWYDALKIKCGDNKALFEKLR
jgi:hypothetical protein